MNKMLKDFRVGDLQKSWHFISSPPVRIHYDFKLFELGFLKDIWTRITKRPKEKKQKPKKIPSQFQEAQNDRFDKMYKYNNEIFLRGKFIPNNEFYLFENIFVSSRR